MITIYLKACLQSKGTHFVLYSLKSILLFLNYREAIGRCTPCNHHVDAVSSEGGQFFVHNGTSAGGILWQSPCCHRRRYLPPSCQPLPTPSSTPYGRRLPSQHGDGSPSELQPGCHLLAPRHAGHHVGRSAAARSREAPSRWHQGRDRRTGWFWK